MKKKNNQNNDNSLIEKNLVINNWVDHSVGHCDWYSLLVCQWK